MVGERLAEIRKDCGEKQSELAKVLCVSLSTVRSWEQGKSSPSHEALISICKRYHVSADYLLGLSDVDPAYLRRQRISHFTKEELRELQEFCTFLLWKRTQQKQDKQDKP
ncbi:MAG: helix-turn-helix transcriptional regulator [Oscillospiraceae bacterium]|nr:helix-turn-helix transcriptional regulator [Oscillospiraceae bacterium]MDY5736619.1 helix-turn-helix transcriptional regulator [Oscillospiraceae bacterium]